MGYKTKKVYQAIADKTGFSPKTVEEIDNLTISGDYSLGALARKYLAKPQDVGKVIDLLTRED